MNSASAFDPSILIQWNLRGGRWSTYKKIAWHQIILQHMCFNIKKGCSESKNTGKSLSFLFKFKLKHLFVPVQKDYNKLLFWFLVTKCQHIVLRHFSEKFVHCELFILCILINSALLLYLKKSWDIHPDCPAPISPKQRVPIIRILLKFLHFPRPFDYFRIPEEEAADICLCLFLVSPPPLWGSVPTLRKCFTFTLCDRVKSPKWGEGIVQPWERSPVKSHNWRGWQKQDMKLRQIGTQGEHFNGLFSCLGCSSQSSIR